MLFAILYKIIKKIRNHNKNKENNWIKKYIQERWGYHSFHIWKQGRLVTLFEKILLLPQRENKKMFPKYSFILNII